MFGWAGAPRVVWRGSNENAMGSAFRADDVVGAAATRRAVAAVRTKRIAWRSLIFGVRFIFAMAKEGRMDMRACALFSRTHLFDPIWKAFVALTSDLI